MCDLGRELPDSTRLPEVDETVVGTWVTDSERTELADRGLDADRLLTDIKEAKEELDHAWAPLAAAFADVVLGDPSDPGDPI
jgi:GMP synthase (glutamine-hydrolysing)